MDTLRLYIGSNNQTKELEIDKIEQTLAKNHEGFTIETALGYWHSKAEKTAVVTITDSKSLIMKSIEELKSCLKQDSIAYHKVSRMEFA